jgi:hypothetical protein
MTAFPQIRSDYYERIIHHSDGEKFAAAIAIEPLPVVRPILTEANENHATIYYLIRTITACLFDSPIGDTSMIGLYATYALRAYTHLYKARKVEEIYSIKGAEAEKVKKKHLIEVAKTVAAVGVSILIPTIAYPLYVANGIINEVQFLVAAIKAKDQRKILEKTVSISIRVFQLFVMFNPDPISKIVLLTFKLLETGYYISRSVKVPNRLIHRVGPIAPQLSGLYVKIPSLIRTVRMVLA